MLHVNFSSHCSPATHRCTFLRGSSNSLRPFELAGAYESFRRKESVLWNEPKTFLVTCAGFDSSEVPARLGTLLAVQVNRSNKAILRTSTQLFTVPKCSIRGDEREGQVQAEGYAWWHPAATRSTHISALHTSAPSQSKAFARRPEQHISISQHTAHGLCIHSTSRFALSCPTVTAWTCGAPAQKCSHTLGT